MGGRRSFYPKNARESPRRFALRMSEFRKVGVAEDRRRGDG